MERESVDGQAAIRTNSWMPLLVKVFPRVLALSSFLLFLILTTLSPHPRSQSTSAQTVRPKAPWVFAVSGDSRNCGDLVMPAIAMLAKKHNPLFYWHLGDFRWMSERDEDMQSTYLLEPLEGDYITIAWSNFLHAQIVPFQPVPVYLGIGNHELFGGKKRRDYLDTFRAYLPAQGLHAPLSGNEYRSVDYHWAAAKIDFIYLDNASTEKFDAEQLRWFEQVLDQDERDAGVKTVVVGMHTALPGSLAVNHSMDQYREDGKQRALTLYEDLVTARSKYHKNIYVLASHAHYYADDVFNSPYWRENGGAANILPGWIVGSAGAQFYQLPLGVAAEPKHRMANVYGYLLAMVSADSQISFEFHEIGEADIRAVLAPVFKDTLVQFCMERNGRPR
jgi:hypothetical protein